jgi:hypothetical protein
MNKCEWELIDDFRSLGEFRKFVSWMESQVASGVAKEVQVGSHYIDSPSLRERWFVHNESGSTWRIVWPDGPFTGIFEQV